MVDDGSLGQVREVHVNLLTGQSLDPKAPLHWRERHDYSGMNTMMMGLYLEAIHRWLGPTKRVMADGTTWITERIDAETGKPFQIEIPDSLGILATMKNGARVSYRISSVIAKPANPNGVSIYGTKGTLHWLMGDRMTFGAAGEEPQPLEPDAGTAGEWRVEQDFIDSIRDGKPVALTSFEDGLLYMRVTEAIYRSRTEGRAVDVADV